MNVYRLLGGRVGTPAALDLGERLSGWHDAVVIHTRRTSRITSPECDDDCPHAQAGPLWLSAVEVFGDMALELTFLFTHGVPRDFGEDGCNVAFTVSSRRA